VRDVKPVKGTFKLHVVAVIGKSEVFVRETSCYCNVCLEGGICDGWGKEGLGKVHTFTFFCRNKDECDNLLLGV
jgi:hypothetical protein